jgi:hypothetical protein
MGRLTRAETEELSVSLTAPVPDCAMSAFPPEPIRDWNGEALDGFEASRRQLAGRRLRRGGSRRNCTHHHGPNPDPLGAL